MSEEKNNAELLARIQAGDAQLVTENYAGTGQTASSALNSRGRAGIAARMGATQAAQGTGTAGAAGNASGTPAQGTGSSGAPPAGK